MLVHYQSANLSDEAIIKNFVVRTDEFQTVIANIERWKKGDSIQHYIYIGRRGSGKSTLLRRIQAEIKTKPKLSKKHLVVNLSEEQAGIYQFYDLWDKISIALRAQGVNIKEIDWLEYENDLKEYSKQLFFAIQDAIKSADKQLIILIDNIDRILGNIKDDAHLFREFLINHNNVRIVGGSTYMAEDFYSYDKPFYEFFKIINLKSLTKLELQTLIEHWGAQKEKEDACDFIRKHPGKIETIRMLTDGLPRTMLLFLNMLIDQPEQKGYEYLRKILDNATPIYQERLGILSSQQQKIILELSFFWEAVSVEDLMPMCKMSSKIISAQLSQLEKARVVEKLKIKGSKMHYRLEERFFNMWLLMTQGGPRQKQQVKYLTVFLENWYEPHELQRIYNDFSQKITSQDMNPDYVASFSKALAHSKHISKEQRDNLIKKARETGSKWIEELPATSQEIYQKAIDFIENKEYENAIRELNQLEQTDGLKYYIIGGCYSLIKNVNEAEKYLLLAAENGNIASMRLLGDIYREQGQEKESEKYYLLAIKNNDKEAVYELANLYRIQKRYEEAEKYYLLAIENKNPFAGLILSSIYCIQNKNKELVNSWIKQYPLKNKHYSYSLIVNILQLWLGKMAAFHLEKDSVLKNLLKDEENLLLSNYFAELLFHKQLSVVSDWFDSEEYGAQLKEIAMPTYYALQVLKDNKEEQLKIPPELEENVRDIVTKVKERQAFYYG